MSEGRFKVGDHVRIRDDGPDYTLELTGRITMLTDLEITIGNGFTMERATCVIEHRPFLNGAPVPHGSHAVCDRVRESQGRRISTLTRERDEARCRARTLSAVAGQYAGENRRLKIMTDQMREGLGFWRDRQRLDTHVPADSMASKFP